MVRGDDMKVVRKTPRGEKTRVVTLRLPETLMKKIDRISEKESISRQNLLAQLIEGAIKDKTITIIA
jgi:metal-responsive CopG/Arc/MetJ family transcriptional regulator